MVLYICVCVCVFCVLSDLRVKLEGLVVGLEDTAHNPCRVTADDCERRYILCHVSTMFTYL